MSDSELDATRMQNGRDDVSMLYPIRRGSRIFVKINGVEIALDPMQAAILAQRWTHEVSAAYVYAKTNEALDELVSEAQELKLGYE